MSADQTISDVGAFVGQIKGSGVFSSSEPSSRALRDDGMIYSDSPLVKLRTGVEQLTYLLFLKMADERDSMAESVVS